MILGGRDPPCTDAVNGDSVNLGKENLLFESSSSSSLSGICILGKSDLTVVGPAVFLSVSIDCRLFPEELGYCSWGGTKK